jgi:hypothetical protein
MALTKVTNTGIADDAVTTDKIEDGTVVAADIAPGTIANAKLANSSITLNGSSVSLGGSATVKHIDWQALTVADGSTTLNTTAGKGYFLDTNAGVIEVFLPTSPTRGDTVVLADYSGTFATNQIIINTGGQLLDSTAGNDFKVTTNNSIVELVYVDAAKGWLVKLNQAAGTTPSSALEGFGGYDTVPPFIAATGGTITTSGDYKIHTFTGDGCFVVSNIGLGTPTNPSTVDYLVVAGGGGSPTGDYSGGAGAGGYRESYNPCTSGTYTASPLATPTSLPVSVQGYPITVGGGGATSVPCGTASAGSASIFSTITSAGGGYGGTIPQAAPQVGGSGGSGGGGGYTVHALTPGGSGNTPPTSPPQGNNGGIGNAQPSNSGASGGGGGGAGAVGCNAPSQTIAGNGGNGAGTQINTSPSVGTPGPSAPLRYFSGGGGGNAYGPSPATGGFGGGGAGGGGATVGTAGTLNTGGGAGAKSAAGGKGIVIIRYKFQ